MATRANLPPITSLHKITHISRPAPRPAVTRAPACRRGWGGSLGVLPRNKAASVRRLGRGKIGSGSCNHTTQQTEQTGTVAAAGSAEWSGLDGMGWHSQDGGCSVGRGGTSRYRHCSTVHQFTHLHQPPATGAPPAPDSDRYLDIYTASPGSLLYNATQLHTLLFTGLLFSTCMQ